MKRTLSIILVLSMLLAVIPVTASATTYSGYCGGEGDGTNLTWELDTTTGVLSIEGSGSMNNSSKPWSSFRSFIKTVVIGNNVTTIGNAAFRGFDALTTVIVGDGVNSIRGYAFGDCSSLTTVTLGDNVESIANSAFVNCVSLTTVMIPDSVKTIGVQAFCCCFALTTVDIGDSVTIIEYGAFEECTSLTLVSIGDSVTTIAEEAFGFCMSLTAVEIGNNIANIDSRAFYYCPALSDVYYHGTPEHWEDISIGDDNSNLTEAEIHYMTAAYTFIGNNTHSLRDVCSDCEEILRVSTEDCIDKDSNSVCDLCGGKKITKFDVAGSNMTLGNELVVNVMFMKNKITGEGNTMEITHGDAVTTIAQENWESYNPSLYVARIPVAAKEMADDLSVVIKNAEGYEISQTYTTSVREYAGKVMTGDIKTYSQEMKNLAVDMLNYGAAAQTNFSYNTEDMANNALTEEQKAWATADVTCANNQVKGTNCAGSNLSLESKILLNIVFKLNEADAGDKYAMVTYTDYTGKAVEYRVDSFSRFNASMQGVVVDEIVLADAFELVTVTVYNADGTVYGTGSDSVESYAARTENDLNAAIMKFAASAKTYLG